MPTWVWMVVDAVLGVLGGEMLLLLLLLLLFSVFICVRARGSARDCVTLRPLPSPHRRRFHRAQQATSIRTRDLRYPMRGIDDDNCHSGISFGTT